MHRSDTDYRPFARALEMLAALALALAPVAGASAAPPNTAVAQEAARLERWIAESAPSTWTARYGATASESADGTPQGGVRIEVTVGRVDPRIKLESCARFEPFLPSHARLWGRSHIGVRCVEGESWTTLVPVTVSVFGTALVANLPIPAGAPADPADFSLREVDLTRTVGIPVADPELLAGRSLGRSFSAIRIRLIGQGFAVSAEGFAMAAAGEGEPLRVRTGSGKMLVGIVRERILEVRL
jgi:flagella basal body P-ring formation protein FlgA